MFAKDFVTDVDIFDRNMNHNLPVGEYPLDNIAAMKMPGGIIVLELYAHDYSMAQIARIVEDNDAKILGCYVASATDSIKLEVTLKINQTDLTSVIRSFQRYDYTVKTSQQGYDRQEDVLRNHYDQFMLYLNV